MKHFFLPLCVGFLICATAITARATDEQQALEHFVAGNAAYRGSEYRAAVTAFEQVLAMGLESGPVYFNLGNSYFKAGQRGRAILSYERALQLMPRDADLRFNYQFVKESLPNYQDPSGGNLIERLMDRHMAFYTLSEMMIVIVILASMLAFGWLVVYYYDYRLPFGRLVFFVLAVLLLVNGVGYALKSKALLTGAVVIQPAQARFEPKADATTHYSLAEGVKVQIIRRQDEWVKIQRSDEKMGWVKAELIEKI